MAYLYCQHCEFTKEVPDKYLGTKGKCPQCKETAEAVSSIPNKNQDNEQTDIDRLEISSSWKDKFKLLENVGAKEHFISKVMTSAKYKSLGFKEKQQVSLNVWAFFFGPLYYLFKKMWLKGALLWGAIVLLNTLLFLLEIITNFTFPSVFYWLPGNILCAQFVNYDYYRYVVHHEKVWTKLSFFSKPLHVVVFLVLSLVLLVSVSLFTPQSYQNQMLTDVSKVWLDDARTEVALHLVGTQKFVTIAGKKIPVRIDAINTDNHSIALKIIAKNGKILIWTFQQIFQDDDTFVLSMSAGGVKNNLSYVRDIN